MWNNFCTFAAQTAKRKEINMQATTALPVYDQVLVNIPRIEMKRFKAIMKALDYELVKRNELDEAIEEVESGNVIHCSSLEELKNAVG